MKLECKQKIKNKRKISIVVIDDSEETVEIFVDILQSYNFDVVGTGSNGKEAIELYKKYQPDVVLLDVNMPEYDGFFGLEGIREIDKSARVVFVTAMVLADIKSKLKNTKPSAICQKPFEIEDMIKQINDLIISS